jgi:methylmalonyl-CoA mutase N-terminal domain/subunit
MESRSGAKTRLQRCAGRSRAKRRSYPTQRAVRKWAMRNYVAQQGKSDEMVTLQYEVAHGERFAHIFGTN